MELGNTAKKSEHVWDALPDYQSNVRINKNIMLTRKPSCR